VGSAPAGSVASGACPGLVGISVSIWLICVCTWSGERVAVEAGKLGCREAGSVHPARTIKMSSVNQGKYLFMRSSSQCKVYHDDLGTQSVP
jgi:hypothetical protein